MGKEEIRVEEMGAEEDKAGETGAEEHELKNYIFQQRKLQFLIFQIFPVFLWFCLEIKPRLKSVFLSLSKRP